MIGITNSSIFENNDWVYIKGNGAVKFDSAFAEKMIFIVDSPVI